MFGAVAARLTLVKQRHLKPNLPNELAMPLAQPPYLLSTRHKYTGSSREFDDLAHVRDRVS